MSWILACIAVLFFSGISDALEPLKICTPGDTQNGTMCTNATTAWDHLEAAIDDLVAHPEKCDVFIWTGDNIDGRGWTSDCWCSAQPDPNAPSDCSIYTNPFTEETCDSDDCGDAEAAACDGGNNPGTDEGWWWCELDRVKNLIDKIEGAGIPWIMVSGNHDPDGKGIANCQYQFTQYNSYFGAGHISKLFESSGSFSSTTPCSSLPSGNSVQSDSSWHILNVDGVRWLFIAIGYTHMRTLDGFPYPGMSNGTFGWVQETIDAHLGMPTIFVAHMMISKTCSDPGLSASYDDAWCANLSGWDTRWTGRTVFDYFLKDPVRGKQIFLTLGGHIRDLAEVVTLTTPYLTAGIAVDFTDPIAGAPAWQTQANGGGGLIQYLWVDPVKGEISAKAYSPYEEAWLGLFDTEPASHFKIKIPLCEDNVRFSFPASACPVREPSPECCTK